MSPLLLFTRAKLIFTLIHFRLMFRLPMAVVVIKEEPADEEMPLDENGPEELNGCGTIFNVMIVKNLFLRNKT